MPAAEGAPAAPRPSQEIVCVPDGATRSSRVRTRAPRASNTRTRTGPSPFNRYERRAVPRVGFPDSIRVWIVPGELPAREAGPRAAASRTAASSWIRPNPYFGSKRWLDWKRFTAVERRICSIAPLSRTPRVRRSATAPETSGAEFDVPKETNTLNESGFASEPSERYGLML